MRPAAQKKGLAALLSGDADDLLPNPTKLLDRSPGLLLSLEIGPTAASARSSRNIFPL